MCGLVGFATTDPNVKFKALFTELLLLSSFRGLHSTGVAAIDTSDNETEIQKVVGNPFCLFETSAYNSLASSFKNVWIGHTRHATRGSVTRWNAHPFEFGDIVGAHNGTIQNDYDLRKEVTQKFGLESDSQVLYAHIAEHGIEDTIPKTRGAWALTFFNRDDGLLYMVKNNERPLWYCMSEDKSAMWWASEWTMLNYILQQRNKIDLWRDEEGYAFFPLEDDTLYGFDVARERGYQKKAKEITIVVEKELKGAEKYTSMVSTPFSAGNGIDVGTRPGQSRLLNNIREGTSGVVTTPPSKTPSSEKSGSQSTESSGNQQEPTSTSATSRTPKPTLRLVTTNNDDSLDDSLLYGPDGQLLFSNEFRDLTANGCLWCSSEISERDSGNIRWVTNKTTKKGDGETLVLCPDCSRPDSEAMENAQWIAGAYGAITEPVVELAARKLEAESKKPKKESKPKKPAASKTKETVTVPVTKKAVSK